MNRITGSSHYLAKDIDFYRLALCDGHLSLEKITLRLDRINSIVLES